MIWIVLLLMPCLISAIFITSTRRPQSRLILKKRSEFIVTTDLESAFLN